MPRRKLSPMKYRGFYCSDEMWAKITECAIAADEDNSEYIRRAVEMRNAQHAQKTTVDLIKEMDDKSEKAIKELSGVNPVALGMGKQKTVIKEGYAEIAENFLTQQKAVEGKAKKPSIPELKEKVKEMERPTFFKGGK